MDETAVQWLADNIARIVMNVEASSPEMARRLGAARIMQAARRAHINVDEVEILSVLKVDDS